MFLSIWRTSLANLDHITSLAAAIATSVSSGGRGDGGTAPDSSVAVAVAVHEVLVRYMPLWAIISLGVYTLSSAQYLVSFMSDRPDAASA